jgi:hypothetical protein
MATVAYSIKADVVDIRVDKPRSDDTLLVDTNVWYWITYSRASQSSKSPAPYQVKDYPLYVKNAMIAGARVCCCCLSFAELAHLIENTERDIRSIMSGSFIEPKVFRHNYPLDRQRVVSEIDAAWAQVRSMSSSVDAVINPGLITAAMARLKTDAMDGYDVFVLEAARVAGTFRILTDDGDFATVPGIQVHTSNRNVVQAACNAGRLIAR